MSEQPPSAVFDCNIFVQSLLNPAGASGACVQHALSGKLRLYLSQFIIDEIRNAPHKPTPARLGVTDLKVERLIDNLLLASTCIEDVPVVFEHPIDRDDSAYINLAIATGTVLIISRDRHLLGLNDPGKPWSADCRQRFPDILIIPPETLLEMLRRP